VQLLRSAELINILDIPRHPTPPIRHTSSALRLFRYWHDPPLIRHSTRLLPLLDRRCAARSHPYSLHYRELGHRRLDLAVSSFLIARWIYNIVPINVRGKAEVGLPNGKKAVDQ